MIEPRTGIVIVFYRPDQACIERANRLAAFGMCVVVDNSETTCNKSERGLVQSLVYVPNGANLGIATALNQGVERLINAGCDSILLFDQDSEPSPELLAGLPLAMRELVLDGRRVAVIGPAYQDPRLGGVTPFVRFGFPALKRVPPTGRELIDVDFLITSGSCVNARAWADIGPMEDALFIDFVDLEWCVRARRAGYAVLGAPQFRLVHSLGDEPIRILGRAYPSHGPLRHYYLFRNATNLMLRGYMPWTWKWTELVAMPIRLAIYAMCLNPRATHIRMSLIGIWHGLTGKMGRLRRAT